MRPAHALTRLAVIFLLIVAAQNGAAQSAGFVEGAGKLGSFATDVLQDFALDDGLDSPGMTAEASGKARRNAFLKGKGLSFAKDKITGGSDISEGMALILNRVFDRLNSHRRRKGGREGMCELAAMNQAWSIASDAKNLRLLRGSANIVFDLLTSSIPGAAGLAKGLVANTGKAAAKLLRKGIENDIKKAWANQQNEVFNYSKSSGDCSATMKVLWNKKRSKFLFIIKGSCGCKEVPVNPPFDQRKITLGDFEVIGGGTITPSLDMSDPDRPKVKLRVGPVTYNLRAQCVCTLIDGEPQVSLPDEESGIEAGEDDKDDDKTERVEEPLKLPMQGYIRIPGKVKCEACTGKHAALLDAINAFNEASGKVDSLAAEIFDMKFDTPARQGKAREWRTLQSELEGLQQDVNRASNALNLCEDTECQLEGPIELPIKDDKRAEYTACKQCESIAKDINTQVDAYNTLVVQMNLIAQRVRTGKLRHGSVAGNEAFREWAPLDAQLKVIQGRWKRLRDSLAKCEAQFCFGFQAGEHLPYTTTSCDRPKCIAEQKALNELEREYNDLIDEMNKSFKSYQDFLVGGGRLDDPKGADIRRPGMKASAKSVQVHNKILAAQRQLIECEKLCRDIDEERAQVSLPTGAGQPISSPVPATGTSTVTGRFTRMIAAGTSCPRWCLPLYDALSALVAQYNAVNEELYDEQELLKAHLRDIAIIEFAMFSFRNPELADRSSPLAMFIHWGALDDMTINQREEAAQRVEQNLAKLTEARDASRAHIAKLSAEAALLVPRMENAYRGLLQCEKRCTKVEVIDTKILIGNDPFDPENPQSSGTDQGPGVGTSGPVEVIRVLPFSGTHIPVSKIRLASPDACASFHYHQDGGPPLACDGSMPADPAPGVCGYGVFSAVIEIPKSSCANP